MKAFSKATGRNLLGGAAMAVVLSCGTAALAQDNDVVDASNTTDESAVIADPTPANMNEIIVTARRRSESLQDTPVAVTAISTAQLDAKNTLNIGDLQGFAPNLLITNQNSGASAANLSIRGLTYADVEKSAEPTVGVVVDGVFIGTSTGQFFDFFDIDQIEVLRGPQGTLFGRNTIGGVINIRRSRPTADWGVKAEVSYGKFDSLTTRAVVNAPILRDAIGIKGFYFHNESDGYYRDYTTGERRGGSNSENFGASLLMDTGEGLDAVFTLEKQIQRFEPINAPISRTGEVFCAFQPAYECNRNTTTDLYTAFVDSLESNYEAPAFTAEINWDAGPVQFTSVTGYRESEENHAQDFDGSVVDLYAVRRLQEYEQISQEFRAAGVLFEGLDYVVGVYYFDSEYSLGQYTKVFGFNSSIDPFDFDEDPQLVNGSVKSYAGFGDFNLQVTDTIRVSFGGRYTRDRKTLQNGFLLGGLIGDGSAVFKKFTPKLGFDYRPNGDMMIYASYQQGFRSGGFSPRAQTALTAGNPYQPEVVDSYELGGKFDLGFMNLNLAGFFSKYNDLQANTTIPGGPTGNQTITDNVASAEIWGIEADFNARPIDNFDINGSIGYLNNSIDGFVVGNTSPTTGALVPFDYSANELIYNPDITASLSGTYTVPASFGDILFNASYRFIDSYDQQISLGPLSGDLDNGTVIVNGNDPRVRSDQQNLLDASIQLNYEIGASRAWLTAFGRNLLDDRGPNAAFTVAGLWSFSSAREPRTYGVTAGFEF